MSYWNCVPGLNVLLELHSWAKCLTGTEFLPVPAHFHHWLFGQRADATTSPGLTPLYVVQGHQAAPSGTAGILYIGEQCLVACKLSDRVLVSTQSTEVHAPTVHPPK